MTDEWAGLFQAKTVNELRSRIEEELRGEKERAEEAALGHRAFEEVFRRVEFPIPESVAKRV